VLAESANSSFVSALFHFSSIDIDVKPVIYKRAQESRSDLCLGSASFAGWYLAQMVSAQPHAIDFQSPS
jgi:hypothetical protein